MKFVNTISFRVSLGELEMTLLFSSLQGISWILYVTKEKPSKGFSLKCGSSLV